MQSLPDLNQLQKMAASPAGQKLMAMLQNNPDVDLTKLAQHASNGDLSAARQQLSRFLASEEASALLRQLEKTNE